MKAALLGTGLLGGAIGERLIESGIELAVYNRTISKAASLAKKGATVYPSPTDAIESVDIVILMLSDIHAIEETLFKHTPSSALQNKLFVQMGTIAPQESLALSSKLRKAGASYCEAPVLGSLPEARSGTLICMLGGHEETVKQALPVLNTLSPTPIKVGDIGQAAAMKLALNQLIASLTCGFSNSLAWVEKHGLDTSQFMEILRGSALYAPTFDKKLSRMSERNFAQPNFPTEHLQKDVRLFMTEARPAGIDVRMLQAIFEQLEDTVEMGHGQEDYSAVYHTIADQGKHH